VIDGDNLRMSIEFLRKVVKAQHGAERIAVITVLGP